MKHLRFFPLFIFISVLFATEATSKDIPDLYSPCGQYEQQNTSINFSWEDISILEGYYELEIYKKYSDNDNYYLYKELTTPNVSYTYDFGFPFGYYKWRVRYHSPVFGWEDFSDFCFFKFCEYNLHYPYNSATHVSWSPKFQWDYCALRTFQIQVSRNEYFSDLVVNTEVYGKYYNCEVTLNCEQEYFWRIRLKYNDSYGPWTEARNFTTQGMDGVPVSLNNETNLSPRLEWFYGINYNDPGVFNIILKDDLGNELLNIYTGRGSLSYEVPDGLLYYSSKYYWKVRALLGSCSSDWSSEKELVTRDIGLYNPNPAILNPELSWEDVGADYYTVQVSEDPDFSNILVSEDVTTNSFTVAGNLLHYGTETYWRVKAYQGDKASGWSTESFVTETNNANNTKLSFQGLLTDLEGVPIPDGTYNLTFRIYDRPEPGNPEQWVETQPVLVEDGIFNVILGDLNPIGLPFITSYWLGIQVENDEELLPRQPIVGPVYQTGFGR